MASVLLTSIESGLVFSLLAIGVVITFKILEIADLSIEGTFPLGAFIFARFTNFGLNPIANMILAFIGGLILGYITFLLFKKLRIEAILAGILTMTMIYTLNLRITGKSNIPIMENESIFDMFSSVPKIVIIAIIVIMVKMLLDWFLTTEKGYLLIATGDNENLVKSLGENPEKYIMLGLMLSNGIAALSGAVQGQSQGFVDITMGQSMIVTALASIVIGDTIARNNKKLKLTTRAILGAIIYRIIIGVAIDKGLNPNDLKGITALIVIIFIMYNNFLAKRNARKVRGGI